MGVKSKIFGKYLLITNTLSCGVMMAAGDIFQQRSNFLKKHMANQIDQQPVNDQTTAISMMNCSNQKNNNDPERLELLVRVVDENEVDSKTSNNFDFVRCRNMTAVGLLQGPFHHYFYAFLEKTLPGKSTVSIFKKTLVDQTIASPTCLGIFFFGLGLMEQKNLNDINGEVKLKLLDTWKVDCMFWPPTQFINFLFVPIQYRVIYINLMTMIYDVFLSYMKYDAHS
ncbi:hypothetical protein TKK_0007750 [Trichogramma kaykai]|uniref:Mpv17-like protein 2 n=1 Tax=Trichogramma kaykai TaxID=54128 RepID=A0ABD2X7U4_9HYME